MKKTKKALEVRIVFEDNRLAAEYVMEAYRQVLPLRHHAAKINKISSTDTETKGAVLSQEVRP